jgi:hypothetical protein
MNIIYAAITIFSMTAILGIYLISLVLRDKQTPKGIAIIHGLFAVTGLLLLITYSNGNEQSPVVSIIVFIIAALGGLVLIYKDLTGQPIPKWLAITHGLTAVVGFTFLILFACCK